MLHVLASQGDLAKVCEYVGKHANAVNDLNYNLQTSLHVAAQYGRVQCLQLLLSLDTANNIANIFRKDRWGNTAVDLAMQGNFFDCVLVLLHFAAKHGNANQLPLAVRPPPLMEVCDPTYQLFLLIAQPHADLLAIEHVLDSKQDMDLWRDVDGRTPAHLAAACGNLRVLTLLHERRHQANFLARDRFQRTPMDEAKKFNHADCVQFLEHVTMPSKAEELQAHGVKQGWAFEENTLALRLLTSKPHSKEEERGTFFKVPCLVKRLQQVDLQYQALKSNWQREIDLLAKLRHPYIQQFYGASFSSPSNTTIIVEQCEGGVTLEQMLVEQKTLKKAVISGEQQRRIVSQIALALLYLHCAHKIVYRNLDCKHVLMFSREVCKLCLPPIQSVLEDKDYRFMAPELIRATDKRTYLPSCDVYSFAMVCFYLFSGNRPFHHEHDVKQAVLRGARPNICEVSSEPMQSIITACWDEEPEARLSVSELLKKFDATRAATTTPLSPKSIMTDVSSTKLLGVFKT